MNDSLLEKQIDKFEYVVSIDEDLDLADYNQYAQSADEANELADKFESDEWQAFAVIKYDLCPHCNQRNQIVDSLCGIIAQSEEGALNIYLNQQL